MSKKFYGLKRDDYKTAVCFIQQLQEVFPITFPKQPSPKIPLMIGIDKQLASEFNIDKQIINNSLKLWCMGARYKTALSVVGADRFDLYGNKVGIVTEEHHYKGNRA